MDIFIGKETNKLNININILGINILIITTRGLTGPNMICWRVIWAMKAKISYWIWPKNIWVRSKRKVIHTEFYFLLCKNSGLV